LTAERSTGAHRSTQACAPFEARFHRYGKKIFCHFSKKNLFTNKNESRLKAHTTKAPKAARNNIRQLGREAENAVGGGGAFRGGHLGAWQKKRTWRYGETP
jgi:hypothetical protein